MTIDDAFNSTVAYYDEWIRKAVPGYDDLFAVSRELIPFCPDEPVNILDLGAGTGLFSFKVLDRCPNGHFVLWDVADKMLETARERFSGFTEQFRYVVDDYRNLPATGSFDLVISSLSIHHLSDGEKRELFRKIYGALRKTGIFINIDLIRGPTPFLEELYNKGWYDKMRRAGAPEEEIRSGIERRIAYDREALMEDQIRWLREAGFEDSDCVYRNFKMGLFLGVKRALKS
ncbi:MAG: methyltransferase domain-containing protein [Geobacteraceae bacterium]|nr:methyltransferase domain-containing protein [Geobacteraceae bacterium]